MKKKPIIREVYRSGGDGVDYMLIADPDGEIDRAYAVHVRPAEQPGVCDTVEISAEFFHYIAMLQSSGVKVSFRP